MLCPLQEIIFNEITLNNINVFLHLDTVATLFSVAINLLCFVTLIKTPSLQTPSNILIAGLCFSDLLVGLLVQPISLTYLFSIRIRKVHSASLLKASLMATHIGIGLSFTYTTIINIDRFLAICHPFKYFEKATRRTHLYVVVATSVTWFVYAILDNLIFQQLAFQMFKMTYVVVAFFSILATNVEVIKVINRQNTAMRSIRTIANHRLSRSHIQRQRKERSKAYTCIIITMVFFICNFPILGLYFYSIRTGAWCWSPYQVFIANLWANYLTTVNTFINPIVYCIRIKAIRKAAKALFCGRNSDDVSSIKPSH